MKLFEGDKLVLETDCCSNIIEYLINERSELGIVVYSKDEWIEENPSHDIASNDENLVILANSEGYTYFIEGKLNVIDIKRILTALNLDNYFSIE